MVTLEMLVKRYTNDTEMLKNHTEYTDQQKEFLRRRIEKHKNDIVEYVTSERFSKALDTFNL